MTDRPNILLIHSDQHRYDCLGVNGHAVVQTPNLDRLAADGINFTHAFTPNPVCSPARACLQTGAWATTHGCVTIPGTEAFRSADPALPVLTGLLSDADYRIAHIGKFHAEIAGSPTDHGAEAFVPVKPAYKRWRTDQGLSSAPTDCGWYGQTDPHITAEQSPLAWQADRTLELIETYAQGQRPWFVRWDPSEPHLPNLVPEPYASMYNEFDLPPWPSFPDRLTHKPEVQRRTRQRWGVDAWSWDDWLPVVRRYLGEITLLDAQVGRLLDRLDVLGLADRTVVVYTTDHGDMCGGHGMMDKHYVMYDDVMRVPLMLRWPGRVAAGTREDFVIHELDLAATFLDAAGIEAPVSFVGRSLLQPPSAEGGRQTAFAQYQGTHQGLYSQRMLRDRQFKYIYNPTSIDELYDLDVDPGEITNLADDPTYTDRLRNLRVQMAEQMQHIGDRLSSPLFDWGRADLPKGHPARPD